VNYPLNHPFVLTIVLQSDLFDLLMFPELLFAAPSAEAEQEIIDTDKCSL
jgi:hypothetical protein